MAMVVFLPLVCALDLDLLCRRYQPVVVNPTCVQAVQDEIVYTGRRVSPRCYCCLSRFSSRRCPAPNPRWGVHEVMKPQVDARKHPGNHAAPISCQDGPRRCCQVDLQLRVSQRNFEGCRSARERGRALSSGGIQL